MSKKNNKKNSTRKNYKIESLEPRLMMDAYPPKKQPPRTQTRRHLKKNAIKMRFYKEFGIFLPKIQNKIKQKHKTKLDNFTKRIYIYCKYENVFSQNG